MKLYELPRGAKLKLLTRDRLVNDSQELQDFTFHHIDGMYSLITRDSDEATLHLGVMQEMKKVGDHYEICELYETLPKSQ